MSRTTNIHEVSETVATFERQLENGQTLIYQMQVLQQPERARACGQGAKSHADRRPVDPPPVVELRLFSGPDQADVTFSHNSNFFLYASLEHARPVAPARGMPAPAPAPVLTGVPVSGMAYLDRPAPAGYFIFPDLSVRHEGRYRLRFALYEDTKEQQPTNDPNEPREFCVHRLDVKSKAFTVFSAKKFPGLAESTALSRIVAEQGCRVRIRRDVRMRRRNDRPRGRDSEDMDETAMLRAQRRGVSPDGYDIDEHTAPAPYQTQQPQYNGSRPESAADSRKRSGSDVSVASSLQESRYPNQYMPPAPTNYSAPPPPPPPPVQQQSSGILQFGNSTSSHPAPPAPYQDYRPSYPEHRPSTYATPPPYRERRESIDDFRPRRESDAYPTTYRPTTPVVPQPQQQYQYQQQQQQQQYTPHTPVYSAQPSPPVNLPPMGSIRLPPLSNAVSRWPASSAPATPAAPSYPSRAPVPASTQFPSYYPEQRYATPTAQSPAQPQDSGKKRPWGRVFNQSHTEGAMRQGQRPDTESEVYGADAGQYVQPDNDEDGYDDIGKLRMTYRRADGIEIVRKLHGDC
ncbi:velvet factor-domain-containing protein [Pyronema omphalodes]|nr:velvet factor-domain-containing protein [Pyronema omphalodes]